MDQIKIGSFIRELRKEKGITQEQLAEALNTSRRTVSRWETGVNMPDLDVLPQLAEFFGVDIRELFYGERKDKTMDAINETILKAAEYTNADKMKTAKAVGLYFFFGLISLTLHEVLVFLDLPETFWVGFSKGATFGLAMCAMVMGILYTTGRLSKIMESKKRILSKFQKK